MDYIHKCVIIRDMFTDPIFRIAVTISLLAHVAVIAPMRYFYVEKEKQDIKVVDLNYIVIERPLLSSGEEVYTREKETARKEEKDASDRDVVTGLSPEMVPVILEKEKRADPAAEEKRQAYLKYYNLIREKIRAEIHSAGGSEEGTVTVAFTLAPDGRLVGFEKTPSGGSPALRQRVARGIRKAQPFPPFPGELGRKPVIFSLTVRFSE